ncbi:MAG TPA: CRISPR-associated endonuclease Cas2 [Chloroflexia bacterium]|nr:CRISPR-associated endonuclease Cas2 [Chloroflexia bacterium]
MVTLFVYDISNDRVRTKVAQICQDYGLTRIQYSAFLGNLSPNRQEELWLKCKRRLGNAEGNLQLFVLTPQDLARSRKYVKAGAAPDQAEKGVIAS